MNLLWDFDGTLFNTYPAYTAIYKEVIGPSTDEKEIYRKLKVSFSHAIRYFALTRKQVKEIYDKIADIPVHDPEPFPGVEEVLKRADQNVIMTHKDRSEVEAILRHNDWMRYFSELVTEKDGFPRKPDPAAYRYLHEKYHVDLVIGDRTIDIEPAYELGIKTCLFQNKEKGADYYVDDYRDFFGIVPGF